MKPEPHEGSPDYRFPAQRRDGIKLTAKGSGHLKGYSRLPRHPRKVCISPSWASRAKATENHPFW